jgi:hypothetical protein
VKRSDWTVEEPAWPPAGSGAAGRTVGRISGA